jgi:ribosomal protein S27AE
MAMYLRKAFTSLAQRSGERLFETAGTLLVIGAILTIVFGIGLIIMVVAWIIATIAFFSIKVPMQQYTYAPVQSAPTMQASRFCPNCGAPVDQSATFCPHCGKQLPPA